MVIVEEFQGWLQTFSLTLASRFSLPSSPISMKIGGREGAYPSLPLRVSGNGDINDMSLVHGGVSG